MRKARAKYVLDLADSEMDLNMKKFRKIFRRDLVFSASSGFCSYRMFVTLRGAAAMIMPDVQESERLNKTLTLFGERCPSGTLDLCTGRAAIKHFLGLNGYGTSGKRRFSDVRPTAELLLRECMAGWPLVQEVESNEYRFKPVDAARSDVPSLNEAKSEYKDINPPDCPEMTPGKLWAASVNARVRKRRKQLDFDGVIGLHAMSFVVPPKPPTESPLIFVITDNVSSTMHLVACQRQPGQTTTYKIRMPWVFSKSHDVFLRFYNLLSQGSAGTISVTEFLLNVHEESCLDLSSVFHCLDLFVCLVFFLSLSFPKVGLVRIGVKTSIVWHCIAFNKSQDFRV